MPRPIFRFAPSPNGRLHLGHAYSALLNEDMANAAAGRLLVRIEDIDTERCTPAKSAACLDDLHWLGLSFEEPVLYQSRNGAAYREAIARLAALGLLYVCTCARSDHLASGSTPRDPDGQPHYPGTCRNKAHSFSRESALRIDMARATALARTRGELSCMEKGEVRKLDPTVWGDVIVARKHIGTSYHLAVTVDDAAQGVTDVVRGEDLLQATSIHRLLQLLLELPNPRYHHHPLLRHETGRKLAKSKGDESLADLRAQGVTPADIRTLLGFSPRSSAGPRD
jgi:glutamyl-Q tRNA(Asp) synthetase